MQNSHTVYRSYVASVTSPEARAPKRFVRAAAQSISVDRAKRCSDLQPSLWGDVSGVTVARLTWTIWRVMVTSVVARVCGTSRP